MGRSQLPSYVGAWAQLWREATPAERLSLRAWVLSCRWRPFRHFYRLEILPREPLILGGPGGAPRRV